ncbi:MAG: tRNA (guanosine(46)-N7)-methyltransferase TrmB [Anaerovoracaceae bacterium]|nr:tRNA (guanosine(46)-N7)-methyltransferase TrmB [Bacillota bacterium]MDY3954767.1 tRNA (guanosine(46)-N7)-methyltransferase TrmB [Anaerovoracaceae bacterium]
MRQRKVKHEEERLEALREYTVKDGTEWRGRWGEVLGAQGRPIYLEMGCGRGHFLAALGELHPDACYIGAEGRSSIVLRALELTKEKGLENVRFIPEFIRDIETYFAPGELSGIYLNFSDPWPKARHYKRRLTYRGFLEGYRRVLKPGSLIEIKTDNDALFAFTKEEVDAVGFEILEESTDLHKTELSARLITTQYERRFQLLNKNINYLKLRV